ncbi:unnamed protein product [Fraxinus pennsylvanica]|uniref:Uncharacterized protein n=1 Tax=Fraxinus pennsylvanica TaxID=56036 RepID=A0AAD2AJG3_9LAMI|nr:unnamed protein product [Fraxinus pennsylvanica]
MVPLLENAPGQEEIAAKWFSQDVFTDADEREDLGNDDSQDEMQQDSPEQPIGPKKTVNCIADSKTFQDEDGNDSKVEILACAKMLLRRSKGNRFLMTYTTNVFYMMRDYPSGLRTRKRGITRQSSQ